MPGEEQRTRSDGPKELPSLRLTRAEVALPKALGPGSEAPAGWSWTASSEGSTLAGGTVRPVGASPATRQCPLLVLPVAVGARPIPGEQPPTLVLPHAVGACVGETVPNGDLAECCWGPSHM